LFQFISIMVLQSQIQDDRSIHPPLFLYIFTLKASRAGDDAAEKLNKMKMKRFTLFGLFALLSLCQLRASEYKAGGITYSYTVGSGEAYVSSADKDIVTANILASFQATDQVYEGGKYVNRTYTYKVTSIGDSAFSSCYALTSVDLSNCTSIGQYAFENCSALTNVNLRNCTSIEYYAFKKCTSLTSVNLRNCTSIGVRAFYQCSALTSVDLSNCTSIGPGAFHSCYALTSVGDLSNCTSIGDSTFDYCSSLTSIDLRNCESIGIYAFKKCTSLTSVDLRNCKNIKHGAFTGCSALTSVDLRNCKSIEGKNGYGAFQGCSSLKSIDLRNCESIGIYAFEGCTALTSVGDLSNCTSIGKYAFRDCSSLTSVGDLSNCTSIGNSAFDGCSALTSVGDLSNCTSIENSAFDGCSALTSVGDLRSCTSIGDYAFEGCSALTSVGDLRNCTSIGKHAFTVCKALTSVGDLRNCTTIGDYAFYQCSALTSVGDLRNCITIGERAFYECSALTGHLDLRQAKELKTEAFVSTALKSVNLGKLTVEDEEEASSTGAAKPRRERVKPGTTIIGNGLYKDSKDLEVVGGDLYSVQQIGNEAFRNCPKITKIYLPSLQDKLGNYAFADCQGLEEVHLGYGCTEIGTNAFQNCAKLNKIEFTENLKVIGEQAFCNDVALSGGKQTTVELYGRTEVWNMLDLSNVETIGKMAFDNCSSLDSIDLGVHITEIKKNTIKVVNKNGVEIPVTELSFTANSNLSKVKYIGGAAFRGCKRLKGVSLGTKLEFLGNQCFENCTGLKSVLIYDSAIDIQNKTFLGCTSLEVVAPGKNINDIGNNAFSSCTNLTVLNVTDIKGIIDRLAFGNCPFKNVYYGNGKAKGQVHTKAYWSFAQADADNEEVEDGPILIIKPNQEIAADALYGTPWMNENKEELLYLAGNLIKYSPKDGYAYADITVAEGTHTIGDEVFRRKRLNSISLPTGLRTIRSSAFESCTLPAIILPETMSRIDEYAFSGCSALTEIYCEAQEPPVADKAFNTYTATLYVSEGCGEAYAQAEGWKNFTNIVEVNSKLLMRYDSLMLAAKTELQIRSIPTGQGSTPEIVNTEAYTNLQNVVNDQALLKRYAIGETEYNALKDAYDAYMQKLAELTDVIVEVGTDSRASDSGIIYTTSGVRMTSPQPGIGIIRYRNGEVRKIMMK